MENSLQHYLIVTKEMKKTLIVSILEMYISLVLTRKVSNIVEQHCGTYVSMFFAIKLTAEHYPMNG